MARKVFRRGVTVTSTTLADIGEIGDYRTVGDKKYRLVYTSASLASSGVAAVLTLESQQTWEVRKISVAETEPVWGVNATGASVPALSYLWAMVDGPLTISSAMTGSNDIVANQAITMAAGEVFITWLSTTTTPNPCGTALQSLSSDGSTPIVIHFKGQGA